MFYHQTILRKVAYIHHAFLPLSTSAFPQNKDVLYYKHNAAIKAEKLNMDTVLYNAYSNSE